MRRNTDEIAANASADGTQQLAHRIEVQIIGYCVRGPVYRVMYAGEVLLEHWNPEFEACRTLLARAITGKLETWRPGGTYPALILDIEKAAKLTVEESDTVSVRITPWKPFAVGAGSRKTAGNEFWVPEGCQDETPILGAEPTV
jgi:hypothetical protein